MKDQNKTKAQLIQELDDLRQRVWKLESVECQQAQEALVENERFLDSIFTSIQDGISVLDKDLTILRVNPTMERMYAFAMPLVGKKCYRAYNRRSEPCEVCPNLRAIATGETAWSVVPKSGPGGTKIGWVELYAFPLIDQATGQVTGVIEYTRDITARKQAEEALQASEARFRSLAESAAAAIFIYQGTKFRYMNSEAVTMTGYTQDELLRIDFWDLIHPDHREMVRTRGLARQQGADLPPRYEFKIATKSGEERWVEFTAGPIKYEGTIAVIGTAYDITERKRLEAQLLQSQKMETIGRLAGGVAHDFNNLLTAIGGYANFVKDSFDLADPRRADIEEVLKAADRAATLTARLLAFSRRQIIAPRVFHFNDLILDMDKMLRRLIGEDIEMVTLAGPDLGWVKADPHQVEQAIINLVVNARHAMPGGGRLTLATANATVDDAFVRQHLGATPGEFVRLTVTDTGTGMSDEVKAHLFEPFFTTKEVGQGTGLGLAMVYGVVKQHGGNVWITSELGRGTTVDIYLPRVEEPAEVSPRHPSAECLPLGHETVLVVEDERNEMLRG